MTPVCGNSECGRDLVGLKATAKFCSPACRTAAYRARRDNAGEMPGRGVFAALRGRVTSHRPITRPMRDRHRAASST